MSLAKKLNLKPGEALLVVGRPADVMLDDVTTTERGDGAVLAFVSVAKTLARDAARAIECARADRVAWIAYPKAGQAGTDLNRDILWRLLADAGVRPVRQIALDDVWSALRFRPGSLDAAKPPPAKKASTKKASTERTSAKKTSAKKTSAKKTSAKKMSTKKTSAKKASTRRAGAR